MQIGPGLFDDGRPTYRKLRRCLDRAKCSWAPATISGNTEVLNGSGFCFWHPERCGVRAVAILDSSRTYASINASRVAKECRFVDEFIWHKTNPFPTGNKKRLKDGFERCLHFAKTADYQFFPNSVLEKSTSKWVGNNERRKNMTNGSGMNMSRRITWKELVRPSNVITMPASSLNIQHPAVYPIGLPDFFIRLMTKEGDVVVDPFLGSGTTALAAVKLGRQFLGTERNEEYVRLAESRISALLKERE